VVLRGGRNARKLHTYNSIAGMLLAKIRLWLAAEGVLFREIHHEPTRTSEDSARARGEELRVGGKALLIRVDDVYRLFVLSAERRLDSAAVKRHFSARKTRFATPEELADLTGLVPGSVPPFGQPVLPFPVYVDPSVFENDRIAFNAGSLTDSIVMATSDYRRVAGAEVFAFGA
jgi:Ala-tRNA(Pro) deacylase